MSFGYSVGDFIAVTKLSWKLYETLQECPQDIKDLGRDLATMYGVLSHIQDDLNSDESAMKAHGESRLKMLDSMVKNLMATLNEIQRIVDKFRPLAAGSRLSIQQVPIKLKWIVSQKKLKKIHQEIALHISAFNLLLTSIGNSSLRRIESGLEDMRLSSLEQEDLGQQSPKRKKALMHPTNSEDVREKEKEGDVEGDEDEDENEQETGEEGEREEIQAVESISPNPTQTSVYGKFQSLDSIVPALSIPTQEIELVLRKLSPFQHIEIAEAIAANCRIAAFEFYRTNALWRTKFGRDDKPTESKPFQLADGSFPQKPDDLELKLWISKIHHASMRLGENDTFSASAIRNLFTQKDRYHFNKALEILRILYPWGLLNVLEFESSLCCAISWCRHLYAWDCAARLESLWFELHPSEIDENWKLNLDRTLPVGHL